MTKEQHYSFYYNLFGKAWYEYVSNKDSAGEIKFLNYGYHNPLMNQLIS
jgi:hypothetical protein